MKWKWSSSTNKIRRPFAGHSIDNDNNPPKNAEAFCDQSFHGIKGTKRDKTGQDGKDSKQRKPSEVLHG